MSQIYPIQLQKHNDAINLLGQIGVEDAAIPILCPKLFNENILIKKVKTSWANIIKQDMIASGGDAAINRNSYSCKVEYTDILLMGTKNVFNHFIKRLKKQPVCFKEIIESINGIIGVETCNIHIGKKEYNLAKDFVIMGILNITNDSFSDGGKYLDYDNAMKRIEEMSLNGVTIIDIGGESTKPNSKRISTTEETERVLPIIEAAIKNFDIPVSIDSYKPELIKSAIKAGVSMVNDISGGSGIAQVTDSMIEYNVSGLIMMNNSPDGISGFTPDADNIDAVETFLNFVTRTQEMIKKAGIAENRIIYDPGIGFGLSTNEVSKILKSVYAFTAKKIPLCLGISRKSYIGRVTGLDINERDSVCNAISSFLITQGVKMFRTHDPIGLKNVISFYKTLEEV